MRADWNDCFEEPETWEIFFWRKFSPEIFEVYMECASNEQNQGISCNIDKDFKIENTPDLGYNILSLYDDEWFYLNYFEEFIKNFDSKNINTLDLQFQDFGLIPNEKIQVLFHNLPNLTNISLKNCSFLSEISEMFDWVFRGMNSIRHLTMDGPGLWYIDDKNFEKYRRHLASLKSLFLKGIALWSIWGKKLSIISQASPWLQALDLTDIDLYNINREGAKALFSGFGNLKYLSIVCDPIDNLAPEVLQAMFQPLQSLQELNLIACRIGYMTSEQLNEIFSPLQNLKKINFGWNDFSKSSPWVRKHFFWLLSGVEIIYFWWENFNNYSRSDFREIFLPLKNAKEINLSLTQGMKEVILWHCPELNPDVLKTKEW